jgi:glycosyltransferase involved in cell wall biosynthesis
MISIIICSRGATYCENVKANIKRTIGVTFEIIIVDNSDNKLSLTQAYNKGASRAIYSYLCFMHEDIIFHDVDWGEKVIDHFNADPDIGLIGIAGGSYKSASPSSWFPPLKLYPLFPMHQRLLQHFGDQVVLENVNPFHENRSRVACIDGVWFCCRRQIWDKVKFDETIQGFHCYDLDFSLSVNKIARVVVVYDILLEHFSAGNYGADWVKATYLLHKKWGADLPLNHTISKRKVIKELEVKSRELFLYKMKVAKLKPADLLNVIWSRGTFHFFDVKQFCKWNVKWVFYTIKYLEFRHS